jgi:hypothetical protein
MWIYIFSSLIFFSILLLSYSSFLDFKKNRNMLSLFSSLFFLLLWLLMQFFFGLREAGIIILSTQFLLLCLLIIDIKINQYRILKFFGKLLSKFGNLINDLIENKLPMLFIYSVIIILFFVAIYVIVKLIKYFWYL